MEQISLREGNYIAFDLETTGLDTQKDEIIQIGIAQFDHNFNITNKFVSLVRPQHKQLNQLIKFLTNINPQELEQAPRFDQIKPQIQKFFEPAPVVI